MPDLFRAPGQERLPARTRPVVSMPAGAYVELEGRQVLSFCGHDYLALASDAHIVEQLAIDYDVTMDTALRDLNDFRGQLKTSGLI